MKKLVLVNNICIKDESIARKQQFMLSKLYVGLQVLSCILNLYLCFQQKCSNWVSGSRTMFSKTKRDELDAHSQPTTPPPSKRKMVLLHHSFLSSPNSLNLSVFWVPISITCLVQPCAISLMNNIHIIAVTSIHSHTGLQEHKIWYQHIICLSSSFWIAHYVPELGYFAPYWFISGLNEGGGGEP